MLTNCSLCHYCGKGSDTLESFLSKVSFDERNLARVSLKLSQLFFFRNKVSRLEHVLFLHIQVSFASYFRKRLSKANLLVCHYLKGAEYWNVFSVCMSVCPLVYFKNARSSFLNFFSILRVNIMAVTQSSPDNNAVRYVLPVSWMTSYVFP